ncbi:MAG: hypothetical protein H5T43_05535 [Methanomethylovorans sp.]|jgi:hypothetical protein|nr:hypothetical protein [Methanomethylovorans sp.]
MVMITLQQMWLQQATNWDIDDSSAPKFAGAKNSSDKSMGVAVSGNYAYVADGTRDLDIFEIKALHAKPLYYGDTFYIGKQTFILYNTLCTTNVQGSSRWNF